MYIKKPKEPITAPEEIRKVLSHTLVKIDIAIQDKPYWSEDWLPYHSELLAKAFEELDNGLPIRKALAKHFTSWLLNRLLNSLGLPNATQVEQMGITDLGT